MKKVLIILVVFVSLLSSVFASNSDYMKYINNALDKNLSVAERIDACTDIRNLSDTVPLSKPQLYALKIAARYKIYNIWALTVKHIDDKYAQRYALAEISKASRFYLEKVNTTKTDTDRHVNTFFLGVFEYATENTTMGTKKVNEELTYLRNQKSTQNQADLLSKIFDLTVAFCKKGTTADDIIKIINSIN